LRLYVARHGETDWNYAGRYQGQRESDLTPLGRRQAQALANELARTGAARVIASPLRRCTQTALPLSARLGVSLETDHRLLEIAHGTWEGRLRAEVERDDAGRMRAWREAPETVTFEGGESLGDVDARWRGFLASLTEGEDVVVVTHDVLVRLAILAAANGTLRDLWKPAARNGGYALLEKVQTSWRLREECHDRHLGGLIADTTRQAL